MGHVFTTWNLVREGDWVGERLFWEKSCELNQKQMV